MTLERAPEFPDQRDVNQEAQEENEIKAKLQIDAVIWKKQSRKINNRDGLRLFHVKASKSEGKVLKNRIHWMFVVATLQHRQMSQVSFCTKDV